VIYVYSISGSFSDGVDSDALVVEIRAALPTPALVSLTTGDDRCNIGFETALSDSEKATLDAVVAAHQGKAIKTAIYFSMCAVAPPALSITVDDWAIVGGITVDVSALKAGPVALRVQGMCKVTLGTADMRVIHSISGVDTQVAIVEGVRSEEWATFTLETELQVPLDAGLGELRLEVRKSLLAVADVRSVVAFFEVVHGG
jgi:hypothetical protein